MLILCQEVEVWRIRTHITTDLPGQPVKPKRKLCPHGITPGPVLPELVFSRNSTQKSFRDFINLATV